MKARLPLNRVLMSAFVLVVMAPVLVVGAVTLGKLQRQLQEDVQSKNLILAKSAAVMIDHFFDRAIRGLKEIRTEVAEKRLINAADINPYLEELRARLSCFESLFILDKNMHVEYLAPYDSDLANADFANFLTGTGAMRSDDLFWSQSFLSPATGHATCIIGLVGGDKTIVGFLNLEELRTFSDRIWSQTAGHIVITDSNGVAVSHPDRSVVAARQSLRDLAIIRKGLGGDIGTLVHEDLDGKMYLGSVVIAYRTDWPVAFIEEQAAAFAPLAGVIHTLYAAMAVGFALSLVIGALIARRINRPLQDLIKNMKKLAHGDYEMGSLKNPFRELEDIREEFQAMSGAVREREQSIQKARDEWERTFHAVPDAIFLMDAKCRIIRINQAVSQIFAIEPEAAVGKYCYDIVHHSDRLHDLCPQRATVTSAQVTRAEVEDPNTGAVFAVTTAPLFDAAGQLEGLVHVAQDITEQKRLEHSYQQAQKMEAVGQLAGGVAHDFNNLLQVMIGYLDISLLQVSADSLMRFNLMQVRKSADRAAELVRQLLAFSRRQSMRMEEVDLNQTIGNVIQMLHRVIGEHIELEFRPGADLHLVLADPGQIEQILMNLTVNARDAMPHGGRILIETENVTADQEFQSHHLWAKDGDYVMASFADTGPGIPQELHEHIFEPFFTTKEVGKGTGLGLATSYGIVKQHSGMIELHSEPGRGATFRAYLPAVSGKTAQQAKPSTEETSGDEAGAPFQGATLMLAEDDPMVRDVAVEILEDAGYRVLVAGDGEEAMRLFSEHSHEVHLVLLDVIMPKASGRTVAESIHALHPETPILFSSGYDFNVLGGDMLPKGEFEVLQKPYIRKDLLAKVLADACKWAVNKQMRPPTPGYQPPL
jgi:PAS domain S-box-containing protein